MFKYFLLIAISLTSFSMSSVAMEGSFSFMPLVEASLVESNVRVFATSPDAAVLAVVSTGNGGVNIYDAQESTPRFNLDAGDVHSLCFNADGSKLLTASTGSIIIWNVADATIDSRLNERSFSAKFAANGYVVAAHEFGETKVYDDKLSFLQRLINGTTAVNSNQHLIVVSSDGESIAGVSPEGITIWDARYGTARFFVSNGSEEPCAISAAFSPDSKKILVNVEGQVRYIDVKTGNVDAVFEVGAQKIISVAFAHEGHHVLVQTKNYLWGFDVIFGSLLWKLDVSSRKLSSMSVIADNGQLNGMMMTLGEKSSIYVLPPPDLFEDLSPEFFSFISGVNQYCENAERHSFRNYVSFCTQSSSLVECYQTEIAMEALRHYQSSSSTIQKFLKRLLPGIDVALKQQACQLAVIKSGEVSTSALQPVIVKANLEQEMVAALPDGFLDAFTTKKKELLQEIAVKKFAKFESFLTEGEACKELFNTHPAGEKAILEVLEKIRMLRDAFLPQELQRESSSTSGNISQSLSTSPRSNTSPRNRGIKKSITESMRAHLDWVKRENQDSRTSKK